MPDPLWPSARRGRTTYRERGAPYASSIVAGREPAPGTKPKARVLLAQGDACSRAARSVSRTVQLDSPGRCKPGGGCGRCWGNWYLAAIEPTFSESVSQSNPGSVLGALLPNFGGDVRPEPPQGRGGLKP